MTNTNPMFACSACSTQSCIEVATVADAEPNHQYEACDFMRYSMHVKNEQQAFCPGVHGLAAAKQKLRLCGEYGCSPATCMTSAALTISKTAIKQTWLSSLEWHSSATQVCHALCAMAQGSKYMSCHCTFPADHAACHCPQLCTYILKFD